MRVADVTDTTETAEHVHGVTPSSNRLPVVVYALIVLLSLILLVVIYKAEFSLSPESLILIMLIIVLALSGAFSELSVGSFLRLRKAVAECKEASASVEREQRTISTSLAALATSIASVQISNTNNINFGQFGVAPADGNELQEHETEDEAIFADASNVSAARRTNIRIIKEATLAQYFPNASEAEFRKTRLSIQDSCPDPISERPVVFDAHVGGEFVYVIREVTNRDSLARLFEKLYLLLTRVRQFRLSEPNSKACMTLLIANETEDQSEAIAFQNSLEDLFKPAKYSGVLNAVIVNVANVSNGEEL
jgi:hypothetical protein